MSWKTFFLLSLRNFQIFRKRRIYNEYDHKFFIKLLFISFATPIIYLSTMFLCAKSSVLLKAQLSPFMEQRHYTLLLLIISILIPSLFSYLSIEVLLKKFVNHYEHKQAMAQLIVISLVGLFYILKYFFTFFY